MLGSADQSNRCQVTNVPTEDQLELKGDAHFKVQSITRDPLNSPPRSVASDCGSLRQGLLGSLADPLAHHDRVDLPEVVPGDSSGPRHQAQGQEGPQEVAHRDLWSHSGLWREGSGHEQGGHRSPVDSRAQQGEVFGPQVGQAVGPVDRLATGLGALSQGKEGLEGLDSLVLEVDLGLGILGRGLDVLGGDVLHLGVGALDRLPSHDSFLACAGRPRGGSLETKSSVTDNWLKTMCTCVRCVM